MTRAVSDSPSAPVSTHFVRPPVAATAAVLLSEGLATVAFSRMVGIATDVEGVPIWWVQTLIPLGAALLLVVALAQVVVLACGLEPRGPERKTRDEIPSGRAE